MRTLTLSLNFEYILGSIMSQALKRNFIIITIWRVGLFLVGAVCVGFVLYRYFGMSGEFRLVYDYSDTGNYISEFTPSGRALAREQNSENGEFYQRVIIDPVYFTVDLPSAYPEATVTIEYQSPEQAITQLGLRLTDDDTLWSYDFHTLENKFIDNSDFHSLDNEQYTLLQRDEQYSSIEDFLAHPPMNTAVGTWLFNNTIPFVDTTYEPSVSGTEINVALRGTHDIYTYIKNEPLEFTFTYEDINYAPEADDISIEVYRLDELLSTVVAVDDGEVGVTGESNGERTATLASPELAEGVYKIVWRASDDIILKHITTQQHKLVFKNQIHLAGSLEYTDVISDLNTTGSTVYTNSDVVNAIAKHEYGIGDITFFDRAIMLGRVDTVYAWRNPVPGYITPVHAPFNDVHLSGDGYFWFSDETRFDPFFGFKQLTPQTDRAALEYVIAGHYDEPSRVRGWTIASTTFDLTQANRADPTNLEFILSAPGLHDTPQGLKVRRVEVVAYKEPITLRTLFSRIKAKL